MWFAIITAALCCLVVLFLTNKDPKPINGVYNQPGKWFYLKYWIFRAMYFRKQVSDIFFTYVWSYYVHYKLARMTISYWGKKRLNPVKKI
jgi:hypothetical protein